jgi:hypothetical protein
MICRYILYRNNHRNPRIFNYTPDLGQAVTGLHVSAPREAGPLTHNIMLHKNSFLLQTNKIISLTLSFFEVKGKVFSVLN